VENVQFSIPVFQKNNFPPMEEPINNFLYSEKSPPMETFTGHIDLEARRVI
jgi:hypothetical protein